MNICAFCGLPNPAQYHRCHQMDQADAARLDAEEAAIEAEPEPLTIEHEGRRWTELRREIYSNNAGEAVAVYFAPAPLTLDDLARIAWEAAPAHLRTSDSRWDATEDYTKEGTREVVAAVLAAINFDLGGQTDGQ